MSETFEKGIDTPAVAALPASGIRRCGNYGGRAKDGMPCQQIIPDNRERCAWHPASAITLEEQQAAGNKFAAVGREAKLTPKRLRRTAADPRFGTPAQIVAWAEAMTGRVARGEFTDYRGLDAQLKLARLALDALGVAALEQLDKLEQLVRNRLQGGGAPA